MWHFIWCDLRTLECYHLAFWKTCVLFHCHFGGRIQITDFLSHMLVPIVYFKYVESSGLYDVTRTCISRCLVSCFTSVIAFWKTCVLFHCHFGGRIQITDFRTGSAHLIALCSKTTKQAWKGFSEIFVHETVSDRIYVRPISVL
jgi:hypothetical protein